MSERAYERYGELWEVFDCETQRSYGRVWTAKWYLDNTFQFEKMPLNMMIRRIDP